MSTLKEKIVGSWYGMAVGDAMGLTVKGLKAATVRQMFGTMDGFKDVRPFLGKGIKRFKMPGLYGAQTQSALAAGDCLLKNKKSGAQEISELLAQLSARGPEHYFGAYRHPESGFGKAVSSLSEHPSRRAAEHREPSAVFSVMGIPVGLLHRDRMDTALRLGVETGLLMSRNLSEVTSVALAGYLASQLLPIEPREQDVPLTGNDAKQVVSDAEEFCRKVEARFKETAPDLWKETPETERGALEKTLRGLREHWDLKLEDVLGWIVQNASDRLKLKIAYPTQGYVLTLFPLALVLVLREGRGFNSALTLGLNMGKEAHKTGVLVGAWAGALYGFSRIPDLWRSGLVNGKEIRLRGEGLFSGRLPKVAKDLCEMESDLTAKEFEVGKKYFPKLASKFTRPTPRPVLSWEDEETDESDIPEKSNVAGWRKFQKDKTRAKRDRRRNLKHENTNH